MNDQQRALIVKLEAKGQSEETLRNFAQALERHNHKKATYVPEHTLQQLMAVQKWAAGGAYFAFRNEAGYVFDRDAYLADCPHLELFYFAKATGTEFVRLDVLNDYFNEAQLLTQSYANDPQGFPQVYFKNAERSGFAKYLNLKP